MLNINILISVLRLIITRRSLCLVSVIENIINRNQLLRKYFVSLSVESRFTLNVENRDNDLSWTFSQTKKLFGIMLGKAALNYED